MDNIISAKNVKFCYANDFDDKTPPKVILNDISLEIKRGEFLAVLGHNGSGKSTIAKHFNAILVPQEGKVMVEGIDTSDEEKLFDIRQHIGMVFQNPDNQIVATITEEDVAFGPENLGLPREETRKRVDDALKTVGMYEYREHAPHLLSGGQKQRIAIAGIIAMRPRCIVLDEPTSMLDPAGRHDILEILDRLNKEYGITVILITHHMVEAVNSDRIIIMDSGKIVLEGAPKELFPQVEKLRSLGLTVPQTVELMYELNKHGFSLPLDSITEDECVAAIASAIRR